MLILSQPAHAGPFNLGDQLFGQHAKAPPIGLYRDEEDGDTAFVLDRSTPVTLLRFVDSPEIWVLSPHPAPRGDTIYKNDMGEAMLRMTRFGGLTVFTANHPSGAPAALIGEAPPIHPTTVPAPSVLLQRLAQDSARTSHALQRLVVFEARDVTPQSASLIADAAGVTAEAVVGIARRADGKRLLARLVKVTLSPGHQAAAAFVNGVLQIVVAPGPGSAPPMDVAGRPSSRRIEVALVR